MMKEEFDENNLSLSGIGGVETGSDAAEFILLGANTVQVRLYTLNKPICIFYMTETLTMQ